mgnify:CR=1 FL=1
MAHPGKKLTERGAAIVRDLYREAETRVLVAEGRKAVRQKTQLAKSIAKKAAKTGLITGAAAAAVVVIHQVRKRRIPN